MKISYRFIFFGGTILCLILLMLGLPGQKKNGRKDTAPVAMSYSAQGITSVKSTAEDQPMVAPNVSDTDEILALLASNDPIKLGKVYKDLLPALIRRNPAAAAAFAQSPEASQWHDDLMVTVAQVWTDMNVAEAEKWATQLSNPTERNMVLGYVCFEEANIDPSRAMQVLDNSAINSVRREIIVENLAQQWAGQDLSPLYDEVAKMPAGDERDGLFKRIALAQSQTNPSEAAQMIVDNIPPGPVQTDAGLYVLRQWAKQNMAAASAWANNFPPGDLHDKAMVVLAGNLYGAYQSP